MVCVNCFCYRPIWSFFWWGWPHHKCPDVWLKIIPPCCFTTTVSVMWRILWKRWYDTHEMYQPSWSGDWAASSYLCVNTILEMNTVQGLTCSAVPALVSLQSLNTCMLGWETVKWQFCVVYVHQACDGLVTCQGSLCQWVLGQHNTLNKKCIRCLLRGPGSASARWRLEDACRPFYDCIAASFVCPVH